MKKQLELEAGPFEDLITEKDEGMEKGSETVMMIAVVLFTAVEWMLGIFGGRHV